MKQLIILTILLSGTLIGCNRVNKDHPFESDSADEMSYSLTSALTSLNESVDDEENQDSSLVQSRNFDNSSNQCLEVAALAPCKEGSREASYNNCTPSFSSGLLSGVVQLDYSDSQCSTATKGNSVHRTFDLIYTTERGFRFDVSSESHSTYDGRSLGGGSRLTVGEGGYELEILGRHNKIFGPAGRLLFDFSISTTAPVSILGGLAREHRVLDGGEIAIDHNLARFTTQLRPQQLAWSKDCCYPVSGGLEIEYSGSRSGKGVVTFLGCESAQIAVDGETRTLTFDPCK